MSTVERKLNTHHVPGSNRVHTSDPIVRIALSPTPAGLYREGGDVRGHTWGGTHRGGGGGGGTLTLCPLVEAVVLALCLL